MSPLATLVVGLLCSPSLAQPDVPDAWAIVVGSNRPGPGQAPLRFAVDDADRVADVFVELGDVPADQVLRLVDPEPEEVLAALDTVRVALEARQGRHDRVLFYYSGHARSGGLDLGADILPLDQLRRHLLELPAELRLVVLDACQSGAISAARGVTSAPSFSTASVKGLEAAGTAIIASSAGDELSQESDEVGGGYFTHHLVVGLRGAADANADGHVTLSEAYDYAYVHTLVSTATTAIGRQHPSLELDLQGHGALTLTRPERATGRLRFGVDDEGTVMLVRERTGAVVAEIDKVSGDELTLAMAPGAYTVSWTVDRDRRACRQTVIANRVTAFMPTNCVKVAPQATIAKGTASFWTYERVFFEVGVGPFQGQRVSPYTERLADFGYSESGSSRVPFRPVFQVASSFDRNLSGLLVFSQLDSRQWRRERSLTADRLDYRFDAYRLGMGLRLTLPFFGDWVVPYAQGVGGPVYIADALATTVQSAAEEGRLGLHGSVGGGLQLMPRLGRTRVFGLFAQVEKTWALGLSNLLGDRHPLGGTQGTIGVRGGI